MVTLIVDQYCFSITDVTANIQTKMIKGISINTC